MTTPLNTPLNTPTPLPTPTTRLTLSDSDQDAMMEELCILTDDFDRQTGTATKRQCHIVGGSGVPGSLPLLHRAFSVFLFSSVDGRLLLQQRAHCKPTFKSRWTNTCCSHPLAPGTAFIKSPTLHDETAVTDTDIAYGIKHAAVRKLEHELGLVIPHSSLHFLTRIQYGANSDDTWGEHEIDYILFAQIDTNDKKNEFKPNMNEVDAVRWVTPDDLRALLNEEQERARACAASASSSSSSSSTPLLTPWFHLIANAFIFKWWPHYKSIIECDGACIAIEEEENENNNRNSNSSSVNATNKSAVVDGVRPQSKLIHRLADDGTVTPVLAYDSRTVKSSSTTASTTTKNVAVSSSSSSDVPLASTCRFL